MRLFPSLKSSGKFRLEILENLFFVCRVLKIGMPVTVYNLRVLNREPFL